jgi:hypothetical protein
MSADEQKQKTKPLNTPAEPSALLTTIQHFVARPRVAAIVGSAIELGEHVQAIIAADQRTQELVANLKRLAKDALLLDVLPELPSVAVMLISPARPTDHIEDAH